MECVLLQAMQQGAGEQNPVARSKLWHWPPSVKRWIVRMVWTVSACFGTVSGRGRLVVTRLAVAGAAEAFEQLLLE